MTLKPCIVPGCGRRGDSGVIETKLGCIEFAEVICGHHWSTLPKTKRRVYRRAIRRFVKADAQKAVAAAECCNRLWGNLRRLAIERAGGIS